MNDYIGAVYPDEPEEIRQYIGRLWKKEYPGQCPNTVMSCVWEYRLIALSALHGDNPHSLKKAKRYLSLLREGIVIFPPLVCINGEVIDGLHRFWAYREAGFEVVRIYQNVPLPLTMKEAA